jgi:hypothetical protein
MGLNLSILELLLGNSIVVLLVAMAIMLVFILKQRRLLKELVEKYRQVIASYEAELKESVGAQAKPVDASTDTEVVQNYLTAAIAESQQRYQKASQAKLPKLDPSQPFSAKIAALRHLYLSVEKEALDTKTTSFSGWSFYEKQLTDITRWITSPKANHSPSKNSRMRLLQERIDVLKPFETENKDLIRKLNMAKRRQEKLETSQQESKAAIADLKKIISELQRGAGSEGQGGTSLVSLAYNQEATPLLPAEQSLKQSLQGMESVYQRSSDHGGAVGRLSSWVDIEVSGLSAEEKKKLSGTINSLELELLKSNSHISNLQKELKAAQRQSAEGSLVYMAPEKNRVAGGASINSPSTMAERFIFTNVGEFNDDSGGLKFAPNQNSSGDYLDHERVVLEIKMLRENNKLQRGLILTLEQELQTLRESIETIEDGELKEEKKAEVVRLERLVNECQNCIETLESEVDNLYAQLQARAAAKQSIEDSAVNSELEELSREREELVKNLQKTVADYQRNKALNHYVIELMMDSKVDSIGKHLVQLLKELSIEAGFYIGTRLGHVEYYASNFFGAKEKLLLKDTAHKEPLMYLSEGTLFCAKGIKVLLISSADDLDQLPEFTSLLSEVVAITGAHLNHIETEKLLSMRSETINDWVKLAKNNLSDLDIQYAFQLEENRKTSNQFIKELKEASILLGLKGGGLMVLENAIGEYENRMQLLLAGGDIIDKGISKLMENVDKLAVN